MVTKIRKRDDRLVDFNITKIVNAIYRAAYSVGGSDFSKAEELAHIVQSNIEERFINSIPTVEEIQDVIESVLIKEGHDKTAKAYILYRDERNRARQKKSLLMTTINDITYKDRGEVDRKRENGNIDGESTMGTMLMYGSEASKNYSKTFLINHEYANAHDDGDIHIHDLDFFPLCLNCCQIDAGKLMEYGFSTGHGFIRPPSNIVSASSLICIIIQDNQNDCFGGQSIPNFDFYLAPFVAKTFTKKLIDVLQIKYSDTIPDEKIEAIKKACNNHYNKYKTLVDKTTWALKEGNVLGDTNLILHGHNILSVYSEGLVDELLSSFDSALKRTEKDTYQGMEIVVHNLNSMHCLPAKERIWVFDVKKQNLLLMDMETLYNNFEKKRYKVFSLNPITKETELKFIKSTKELNNNRNLITLQTKVGQKVTTTTDHRILTYDDDNVLEKYPKDIDSIISPKGFDVIYNKKDFNIEEILSNINTESSLNTFNIPVVNKIESNSGNDCVYDISVEDNENFLTEDCIFVHNCRAGAQVPFSSINYGMDTSAEGRMVTKNIMLALNDGLGNGETPIFPIHIFKVKDGVNGKPDDPNYDLYELSIKVSAKRLFPNWVFLDAPFNLKYYVPENIDTHAATMGCVDGQEVITYKYNGNLYVESFERAWKFLTKKFEVKTRGKSQYCDLKDVTIYDSHSGKFVECKKIICNPDKGDWTRITFSDKKILKATLDHPLPVKGKGRTFVRDIRIGDEIPLAGEFVNQYVKVTHILELGYLNRFSYDVETESDYFDVSGIISHNCRTRVVGNVYDPTREIFTGRGNLSFTSINLPRLGIEHRNDVDSFFIALKDKVNMVFDQLLERFKVQAKKKIKNFPFLMGQGIWIDSENYDLEDSIGEVMKHGTLSVGFIGLAECLVALIGKHHGESEEAQKLGLKIVKTMREMCDAKSQEMNLNFSLIGSPAEGLSGRFLRIDRKRYGIIQGITDRDYYTNSSHIPVYYPISAAKKIQLEAPYHEYENGGAITYVEVDGDPTNNLEAMKQIVDYMKEQGIGYGSINHPVDRDPVCGYTGIIGDVCPRCGRRDGEAISVEILNKIRKHRTVDNRSFEEIAEHYDTIPNIEIN